jgi:MHS family proline/betaine transporter-like MFS transporter
MNLGQKRRVIAAGMIGNVLEWYDFAIYGYFASEIGKQFFRQQDPVSQLLSAFGVFAVGCGRWAARSWGTSAIAWAAAPP